MNHKERRQYRIKGGNIIDKETRHIADMRERLQYLETIQDVFGAAKLKRRIDAKTDVLVKFEDAFRKLSVYPNKEQ